MTAPRATPITISPSAAASARVMSPPDTRRMPRAYGLARARVQLSQQILRELTSRRGAQRSAARCPSPRAVGADARNGLASHPLADALATCHRRGRGSRAGRERGVVSIGARLDPPFASAWAACAWGYLSLRNIG